MRFSVYEVAPGGVPGSNPYGMTLDMSSDEGVWCPFSTAAVSGYVGLDAICLVAYGRDWWESSAGAVAVGMFRVVA